MNNLRKWAHSSALPSLGRPSNDGESDGNKSRAVEAATGSSVKLYTLDAMRGVAALMVAALHFGLLPKGSNPELAVDFFFALSGFVIAYSYDRKLSSGMTDGQFIARRAIRLYPLFVLGLVVGLVVALGLQAADGSLDARLPLTQFLCTLFFLPVLPELSLDPQSPVAPLNGPYWSLILEFHINVLFAVFFRWLGIRTLSALVTVFGVAIIWTAWTEGNLAGGYLTPTFYYGVFRVGFSFLIGVLICRLRHRLRAPALAWPVALVLIGVLLVLPTPESLRWIFSLVCVLVLFPMLILGAAAGPQVGSQLQPYFALVGAASYALYAIHGPIAYVAEEVAETWTQIPYRIWGLLFLLPTLAASFAAVAFFDLPIRRWLTLRYQQRSGSELASTPAKA